MSPLLPSVKRPEAKARNKKFNTHFFGPTYVAHIPPLEGWYSRDSLCYGVRARVVYLTAKCKKEIGLQGACLLALGSLGKTHARRDVETELRPGVPRMGL